ncbi:MAG: flagellar biosynthesis protein FlhF [Leptothrix sp. (in: b-proteobacteria)]
MNVKRFIGRNSRDAMQKVRLAFGDNAVVLSTKPCSEGVEILAMAPESVSSIERFDDGVQAPAPAPRQAPRASVASPAPARQPLAQPLAQPAASVQTDVGTLAMSTLSFQDYVRERMLKKRQAELREQAAEPILPQAIEQRLAQRDSMPARQAAPQRSMEQREPAPRAAQRHEPRHEPRHEQHMTEESFAPRGSDLVFHDRDRDFGRDDIGLELHEPISAPARQPAAARAAQPAFQESTFLAPIAEVHERQGEMMRELRAMKGMIEERFGALAFMDRLQKSPKQAQLIGRLIECGFSPALIRKLVEGVTDQIGDELAWAANVLQRNLLTGESDLALEDQGGVFAMIGSTGVGKTTSTAKLAAAFATRHGAGNLGLITLDAYRLGAHEQLRAYGRILGVPVHTAHDRVALEDLLDLLSSKKMVLIDTAGLAQRDARTRELLEMLSHRSIERLLVVNAAQQGETIEDVLLSYKAADAKGIVLSKLDEAVKLGPALDAMIRHRLKVVAVANGQRVPEDWHRLTAQALMHRALRSSGAQAWRMDASDVNLMFANAHGRPLIQPKAPARTSARSAHPAATRSAAL